MNTEEKTCRGTRYPKHMTRIDDEALEIEISFKLNKEGFLIGTQDQREIVKGKFPKKRRRRVLARREEERLKTLDRLDRDLIR